MKLSICKLWLSIVAYKGCHPDKPDIIQYYSKFDDSYITSVGFEKDIWFLARRWITRELSYGSGYSLLYRTWFGWDSTSLYEFKPGHSVMRGDRAYVPRHREDFIVDVLDFCTSEFDSGIVIDRVEDNGVWLRRMHTDDGRNIFHVGKCESIFNRYPTTYGRGEWTAHTYNDCRQMAKDFQHSGS